MQLNRYTLAGTIGTFMFAWCGSALARKIGLSGWEIWPVAGFAGGLMLAGGFGLARLSDRIKVLEDKIGSVKDA